MQTYPVPLTENEMFYILDRISIPFCFNTTIRNNLLERIRSSLYKELCKIKLIPSEIDTFANELSEKTYRCFVEAGTNVGIASAQSIGERQTQLSLDSFHYAGVTSSMVITGVPRFTELVNASKHPKNTRICIYPQTPIQDLKEIREKVGIYIENHTLGDFWIVSEPLSPEIGCINGELYAGIMDLLWECHAQWVRVYLDRDQLFRYRISLHTVACKIRKEFPHLSCTPYPISFGFIDIGFTDNSLDIPGCKRICIQGIPKIEKVIYDHDKISDEWRVITIGNGPFQSILGLPFIDPVRTVSNHVWDIFNVLGIEAAREFLVNEITTVISTDSYINPCHVGLLVDTMLYTGIITPINRYGINKHKKGGLTKATFEQSLDHLIKAGVYNEKEDLEEVSSTILCGVLGGSKLFGLQSDMFSKS